VSPEPQYLLPSNEFRSSVSWRLPKRPLMPVRGMTGEALVTPAGVALGTGAPGPFTPRVIGVVKDKALDVKPR
jgi:hypothetical protein